MSSPTCDPPPHLDRLVSVQQHDYNIDAAAELIIGQLLDQIA